jgi:competence protein ComEA
LRGAQSDLLTFQKGTTMFKQIITALTMAISLIITTPVFAEDTSTAQEAVILYVDINTDSAEKMADLLKGVGLKKAQAIVEYRTQNGAFSAPEDLLNVSGIGPSTLEKNRLIIRIGETE